jgi:AcrR family transcriptional regulator
MSETPENVKPSRRRRSDARRSIDAILGGARNLFGERPDATMEDVAQAAGVSRQTVYAHFPSRDALIASLIEAAGSETVDAIDAAHLDAVPPLDALWRYLAISWQLVQRYPFLLGTALGRTPPGHAATHLAGVERLEEIIRRGRQTGVFDRELPADWLAAAVIGLCATAAARFAVGRATADEAYSALSVSVLRLCTANGAAGPGG